MLRLHVQRGLGLEEDRCTGGEGGEREREALYQEAITRYFGCDSANTAEAPTTKTKAKTKLTGLPPYAKDDLTQESQYRCLDESKDGYIVGNSEAVAMGEDGDGGRLQALRSRGSGIKEGVRALILPEGIGWAVVAGAQTERLGENRFSSSLSVHFSPPPSLFSLSPSLLAHFLSFSFSLSSLSLSSLSLSLPLSLSGSARTGSRRCVRRVPIMRIALSLMARRRQEGSGSLAGGGGEAAA
jgi:hypothetical protein